MSTPAPATETPAPATTAQATPTTPAAPAAPATPATPGTYTDAQLQAFAAASHDIEPLTPQLQSATPSVKTAAVEQVRTILARNNLDVNTYNAIAAQAQSDPALAARIAALRTPSSTPG